MLRLYFFLLAKITCEAYKDTLLPCASVLRVEAWSHGEGLLHNVEGHGAVADSGAVAGRCHGGDGVRGATLGVEVSARRSQLQESGLARAPNWMGGTRIDASKSS